MTKTGKLSKNVSKRVSIFRAGLLLVFISQAARAQDPAPAQDATTQDAVAPDAPGDETSAPVVKNGFHLYQAGASTGYESIPGGILGSGTDFRQLGCDCGAVAAVTAGYTHTDAVNHLDLIYSPSYSGIYGVSGLQSFNQNFQLAWESRWGPKWSFALTAAADDSSVVELALQPFASLLTPSSSAGNLNTLSGASPALPPSSLLYGGRVLSTGGRTSVTYLPTTRLHISLEAGAYQLQNRDGSSGQTSETTYVIPRTTFETVTANLSYSLTPLSAAGVSVSTIMDHTALGDYRSTNATATYSRKLDKRWSILAEGGVGYYAPGAITSDLSKQSPGGSQFVGELGAGYQGRENSFLVSYERSAGDLYGLASSSTDGGVGVWRWRQPGRNWAAYLSVAYQRLTGGPLGDGTNWQANAVLSKALTPRTSMILSYGFLKSSLGSGTIYSNDSIQVVRFTLLWSAFQVPAAFGGPLGSLGTPY
jgi:hypothetical protein